MSWTSLLLELSTTVGSYISFLQAEKAERRKNDGPLYLEAVDLTLRETSHPGSVPSSERPKKITATKELVLPENQLVKKKAMALQA